MLIAGGAGYIGSRLVPFLAELGHDVTVLDLLWFGNNLPSNIPVIQKDVFDITDNDVQGYDIVIFLAGLSNDPMAEYAPSMNFIANASAPSYLAYISKRAGVKKFIYAGTCSVYGYTQNQELDEESPTISNYPYGISKLQGEFGVMRLADSSFSVICLRQGTLSGYSTRMRFDLLVNTMYMKAMTEGKITVNNPVIWRPLLAMTDLLEAYKSIIERNDTESSVINLSSENVTIGQAASEVKNFFKESFKKDIAIETKNIPDMRNYKVSNTRAKTMLNMPFTGNINTILHELGKHIDTDFDFMNDKHYNIKIFKKTFRE